MPKQPGPQSIPDPFHAASSELGTYSKDYMEIRRIEDDDCIMNMAFEGQTQLGWLAPAARRLRPPLPLLMTEETAEPIVLACVGYKYGGREWGLRATVRRRVGFRSRRRARRGAGSDLGFQVSDSANF